jgi:hypothetical protein
MFREPPANAQNSLKMKEGNGIQQYFLFSCFVAVIGGKALPFILFILFICAFAVIF